MIVYFSFLTFLDLFQVEGGMVWEESEKGTFCYINIILIRASFIFCLV